MITKEASKKCLNKKSVGRSGANIRYWKLHEVQS